MKKLLISIIRLYQKVFSIDNENSLYNKLGFRKRKVCVFYPTCSEYTAQSIEKYGSIMGIRLGIRRIIRCHPWQKNHFDPVP